MINNQLHLDMLTSPSRSIISFVDVVNSDNTLYDPSLTQGDWREILRDYTITRAGANKFFGFGIGQEITVHWLDKNRIMNVNTDQQLRVWYGESNDLPPPLFHISEVTRDENTNELTVKGVDKLYKARNHTFSELGLTPPYTLYQLALAIAECLGFGTLINIINASGFDAAHTGNYEGTETLREVLDDIAEATQTIYYVCCYGRLTFKRPDKIGDPVLTISKADYFTLKSNTSVTLSKIVKATELGDNLSATTGEDGVTQYVRDNPFWEMLDDTTMATKLNQAIEAIGGVTANQFNCHWRGNYLLEPVDKIALITKDGTAVTSYYINDKITYNGGLTSTISWEYPNNDNETADNPVTISDALNKTYAKVDKIEKNITLYVGEIVEEKLDEAIGGSFTGIEERVSKLELTTESITADVSNVKKTEEQQNEKIGQLEVTAENVTTRVSEVETTQVSSMNAVNTRIDTLAKETALKVDADGVEILVSQSLSQGVNKVTTSSKKYTFDDSGLDISSSGSNISTTITENGMKIFRAGNEVLIADNEGVKAEDLHASTYLIIGNTSRLEDRENRTACFWIGD